MSSRNTIVIAIVLCAFAACSKSSDRYKDFFHKSKAEWVTYMNQIGIVNPDLSRHVILVSHSTACSDCLEELMWWNTAGKQMEEFDITLIVLEKYKTSFDVFLKTNNINLSVYRDSAGLIFKRKLIPYPPVKFYFDQDSKIAAIEQIGTNGHLTAFVKQIKADE